VHPSPIPASALPDPLTDEERALIAADLVADGNALLVRLGA
jgi:hypothetical protein